VPPKMCPACGQPVNVIDGKRYCFRCCSEVKVKGGLVKDLSPELQKILEKKQDD